MPRSAPPLSDWYVISLRPRGQNAGLRKVAAKLGASTFALPLFRLEALSVGRELADVLACSRIIVTSPTAVRFAQSQCSLPVRPDQHGFAIGSGSAAALRRWGLKRVEVPRHGADSEALLALAGLAHVRGQRIGLITAPGGRGLIAERLRERGAIVRTAEVYRRVAVLPSPARLRALNALPGTCALLVSSAEALNALWRTLEPPARVALARRPCVTSSERLQALAQTMGFDVVIRADNARPAALLSALTEHVSGGGFR
jgi:uroporphyrinogen-III synthase